MAKALIVYGTRSGTTADTSQVIADTLKREGFEVRVVNAKNEKVQSIGEYDIIIVGSGIQMGKWTGEPESFIKKFQKELSQKKLALFVSCGSANPLSEGEQRAKEISEGRKKYLEDKASDYGLKPIALGFFGGCYDFNNMSWFFKRTLSSIKPKLEGAGYRGLKPGLYDLRNLDDVRSWTEDVAEKVAH